MYLNSGNLKNGRINRNTNNNMAGYYKRTIDMPGKNVD